MGEIALVARREIVERTRSRAFLIGTAVQVVLVVGLVIVTGLLGGNDTTTDDLGTVGPEAAAIGAAAERIGTAPGAELRIRPRPLADPAAAEQAVRDGEVDTAVVDGAGLVVKEQASDGLSRTLAAATRAVRANEALAAARVPPAQAQAALDPPPLAVRALDPQPERPGPGLAFVGVIVLYLALFTYGLSVASGVVEEKVSRVVELLVAAVAPVRLLAGKVIGLGLIGVVQLAVIGVVGLVAAQLVGSVDIPSGTPELVGLIVLWFVLGYALYATVFAIAGAIVSRQEDLQSSTTPVNLLLVVAYLISFTAIQSPDGTLARVATYVPFTAPMTIPARYAAGNLPTLDLLVSIALSIVTTVALVFVAGHVYRRAVLRFGAPVRLRELLGRRPTASAAPSAPPA